MNNEIQTFDYQNTAIAFQLGEGGIMVNATEMAKPFGKLPNDYLRLPSTIEFIGVYKEENQLRENPVITKTGKAGGTWMHEDIALDFAQWLSPRFRVWVNARIKELLRHGMTATPQKIEEMLLNPDAMIAAMEQLKAERAAKEMAEQQLSLANKTIEIQAPKVEYYNQVLQAQNLITTNAIAADLGMSAIKLNELLRRKRIIYKQSGIYMLYSEYRGMGYADYRTHTYKDSEGRPHTTQKLRWTETGRRFIIEQIKPAS